MSWADSMPHTSSSKRTKVARRALAGALIPLALGSCTRVTGNDRSPPQEKQPPVAGELSFGVFGEPATLDPFSTLASELSYALVRPVYRSLYRLRPDGSVSADLAESERGTSRRTIVRLRRARWNNGLPIVAKDVVASIRRARDGGRLSGIRSATAVDARAVELRGRVSNWQRALAAGSLILPRGRFDPAIASGPYSIDRRRPGLGIDYEVNPRWDGPEPRVARIKVRFVASLEIMLALLERGRLDAAWPPSAVNLHDRLEERGLESGSGPWPTEFIYLDLAGAALSLEERRGLISALPLGVLEQGLVRDLGDLEVGLDLILQGPSSLPDQELQLAAPAGDELLIQMQRAFQEHLENKGVEVEILAIDPRTYYSRGAIDDPVDVALRRGRSAPGSASGWPALQELKAVPLFEVESVVAWRPGVEGIVPPASIDGPLGTAESWSASPGG